MKKIITVVGARPQFVKIAPVSKALFDVHEEIIINTGQHYDYKMAGVFFEELRLPAPKYNLGVGSASHGKQTGEMMTKLEEIVFDESPDALLVYGDTNSTLAGALVASKLHIPLFHVEAGLRSYNKEMPEEVNRLLTDHVSNVLFAPTRTAVENLNSEGIRNEVVEVGDVMFDAFLLNSDVANRKHNLSAFGVESQKYVLATIHRAENTDRLDRLEAIFRALDRVSVPVVLPLHPRTEKRLREAGLYKFVQQSQTLQIIEPVSYLEMILLESHARAVVTDSGGVQKEAYFAKVPCFTLREETEWVETVRIGWNRLVNPLTGNLNEEIEKCVNMPEYVEGLYGDGRAGIKIAKHISEFLSRKAGKEA